MNKETELALKLLAAATDRLIRLCNLEESKVPTGFMPLLRTVTTQTLKLELVPPWIAFTLMKDVIKVEEKAKRPLPLGCFLFDGAEAAGAAGTPI